MRRSTLFALPLALASAALLAAPVSAAPRPDTYFLPGDDVYPEGITADGSTFYVTSAADGTIYRGDVRDPQIEVLSDGEEAGRTAFGALGLDVSPDGERLVVAGGSTGQVSVLDTSDGSTVETYVNSGGETFLNDVAVARNGDAYITDSRRPVLYRLSAEQVAAGGGELEELINFDGTDFAYVEGFNANGIVITPDQQYAIIVQSATGLLFRVALTDGSVTQVDLGGERVTNGDGLELRGRTLYVVRNDDSDELVTKVRLRGDSARGTVVSETTDDDFAFPTTAAVAQGRLLVVNGQFDLWLAGGEPEPFTVVAVPVP